MDQVPSLETVRREVEAILTERLMAFTAEYRPRTDNRYVDASSAQVEALVQGGGKRLRAYVACLAYATAGGGDVAAMERIGAALEFFHLFALVHDDIIDQAVTRRGVTTIHTFTEAWLLRHRRQGSHQRVGEAQAILWGDVLVALAAETWRTSGFALAVLERAAGVYSEMFQEVVLGQMLDVDFTTRATVERAEIERKTVLKSALYSFVRPMQIGVRLAGGNEELSELCAAFGTVLGTAFQLQDDLFDVMLTEEELGKPVMQDIQSGQQTLLTAIFAQKGLTKTLAKQKGRRLRTAEVERLRRLFREKGVFVEVEKMLQGYVSQAEALAEKFPEEVRSEWKNLIRLVAKRKK